MAERQTMAARVEMLEAALAAQQGHEITAQQRDGLVRALEAADAGRVTAKIALGSLVGANQDWPLAHVNAAREAYHIGSLS